MVGMNLQFHNVLGAYLMPGIKVLMKSVSLKCCNKAPTDNILNSTVNPRIYPPLQRAPLE